MVALGLSNDVWINCPCHHGGGISFCQTCLQKNLPSLCSCDWHASCKCTQCFKVIEFKSKEFISNRLGLRWWKTCPSCSTTRLQIQWRWIESLAGLLESTHGKEKQTTCRLQKERSIHGDTFSIQCSYNIWSGLNDVSHREDDFERK